RSRPAISCIRVVLPASVVPSRTLKPWDASSTVVGAIWRSAPTRRVMPFRASDTLRGPRLAPRPARRERRKARGEGPAPGESRAGRRAGSALAGPALDQLLVLDGFALGLLVVELGLGPALADPLVRLLLGIQARPAAAIDLRLLVGALHALHHLVHLLREAVHRLLRREGAGVDVADVLPPELGELGIVGHVDPGGRPVHPVGRAIELDQAAELGRAVGEALVTHRAVADEGQADVALLGVHRL